MFFLEYFTLGNKYFFRNFTLRLIIPPPSCLIIWMYILIYLDNNNNGDKVILEKIMSKDLIVGKHSDNLIDIARLMREYDTGFIPIAKEQKIIGVITDRDIVINCISNNEEICTIENYINRNLVSIDKSESVESAIKLMGKYKIKRLLISDDGYLAGVVSISDIINTDVDKQLLIDNLKKTWEITHNNDRITPKVNEFKL